MRTLTAAHPDQITGPKGLPCSLLTARDQVAPSRTTLP